MRRLAIFAIWSAFLTAGCSSSPDQSAAHSTIDSETNQMTTIGIPHEPGLYLRKNVGYEQIKPGNTGDLRATNAEHGFGFSRPVGIKIREPADTWKINKVGIEPGHLHLTRYDGVSVASDYPFAVPTDADTAWLAAGDIDFDIEAYGDIYEIHLSTPLGPGFYLFHDDTLIRAARTEEVTAFYPFVITGAGGLAPDQAEAESCFKRIAEKQKKIPAARCGMSAGPLTENEKKEVTECISAVRRAWKISGDAALYTDTLVYLAHILNPGDAFVCGKMAAYGDLSAGGVKAALWKRLQWDHIWRLSSALDMIEHDKVPSLGIISSIREFYRQKGEIVKSAALETLVWVPFSRISPADPSLRMLFSRLVSGRTDWLPILLKSLGALAYYDIRSAVSAAPGLSSWQREISDGIPRAFRVEAGVLAMRKKTAPVMLGPISFDGISESELASWQAAVEAVEPRLQACSELKDIPEHAVFILDLPLNGAMPDVRRGRLRDPVAAKRSIPVLNQDITNCILDAFAEVPVMPALETTQTAHIAVTVANGEL